MSERDRTRDQARDERRFRCMTIMTAAPQATYPDIRCRQRTPAKWRPSRVQGWYRLRTWAPSDRLPTDTG